MIDRWTHRVLPALLVLGALAGLRASGWGVVGTGSDGATVAVGFLLVGAFLGGSLSVTVGLPRLTGYLAIGLLVGPQVSGLLTKDMLTASRAVEGVAVALIALTAGGELRIDWIRRQARTLAVITAFELTAVGVSVTAMVLLARPMIPFLPDDMREAAIIALVWGAIAVANSPTVTIAVIAENRAEGPLTRAALGVTILKDVCVIVLFAIALTVARDALGQAGGEPLGTTLAREIGGSALAGVGFGAVVALFLRRVARDTPVFVLALCFTIWQVSALLHLEALIVALVAGFFVENVAPARGEPLIRSIERVSLPVYALFFAMAGAKVDLDALATLWPVVLVISVTRGVAVFVGTTVGARLSGAHPVVQRYAWLAFLSQAGVTLALATLVARTFPTWGAEVQAVTVAMVAIHELIGPIGFQWALRRAGEVGARIEPSQHTVVPAPPRADAGRRSG